MYTKNLNKDLRLRLSDKDMSFLKDLAETRSCSVSEVIRSIIGEYRRGMETLDTLRDAMSMVKERQAVQNGDTKTDFHNIV